MKSFNKIFLFLFFLLIRETLQAQVPFLKTFQVDKEQSDLRIQRMIRDSKGFIWIGTSNGLFKFNGFEFLKIDGRDIHDSSVTALYEDSHDKLWIGYKSGKIATLENNLLKLFTPAINFFFTSSAILEGIYALDAAEHFCPWYSKAPRSKAVATTSASALLCTSTKSLPPVSPTMRG